MYDFGVATLKVLKKLLFLNLQPTQTYLAHISKQTYDKFWWRTQISRSKMSQRTTPANYRDTVGTDNDYFLRSKKANEHTGSTGLDLRSILFSPLPRLRMPVLQSPFNSITQRTPTQQPPEQQPQQLQQPGQQPQLQPDPQLPGHQPQIQQQQLSMQQQKPVHYSNYKSMGHVHLKPYQGKDQSPVTFWALFIQYCTLLKYSEYETATSFPFFVTDYFQVRQVGDIYRAVRLTPPIYIWQPSNS